MNKPYSGNSKPFVLALFSEKDTEKVTPVLEALEKKGLTLCGQDGRARHGETGEEGLHDDCVPVGKLCEG